MRCATLLGFFNEHIRLGSAEPNGQVVVHDACWRASLPSLMSDTLGPRTTNHTMSSLFSESLLALSWTRHRCEQCGASPVLWHGT